MERSNTSADGCVGPGNGASIQNSDSQEWDAVPLLRLLLAAIISTSTLVPMDSAFGQSGNSARLWLFPVAISGTLDSTVRLRISPPRNNDSPPGSLAAKHGPSNHGRFIGNNSHSNRSRPPENLIGGIVVANDGIIARTDAESANGNIGSDQRVISNDRCPSPGMDGSWGTYCDTALENAFPNLNEDKVPIESKSTESYNIGQLGNDISTTTTNLSKRSSSPPAPPGGISVRDGARSILVSWKPPQNEPLNRRLYYQIDHRALTETTWTRLEYLGPDSESLHITPKDPNVPPILHYHHIRLNDSQAVVYQIRAFRDDTGQSPSLAISQATTALDQMSLQFLAINRSSGLDKDEVACFYHVVRIFDKAEHYLGGLKPADDDFAFLKSQCNGQFFETHTPSNPPTDGDFVQLFSDIHEKWKRELDSAERSKLSSPLDINGMEGVDSYDLATIFIAIAFREQVGSKSLFSFITKFAGRGDRMTMFGPLVPPHYREDRVLRNMRDAIQDAQKRVR